MSLVVVFEEIEASQRCFLKIIHPALVYNTFNFCHFSNTTLFDCVANKITLSKSVELSIYHVNFLYLTCLLLKYSSAKHFLFKLLFLDDKIDKVVTKIISNLAKVEESFVGKELIFMNIEAEEVTDITVEEIPSIVYFKNGHPNIYQGLDDSKKTLNKLF